MLERGDFDLDIACGGGIEEALEAAMALGAAGIPGLRITHIRMTTSLGPRCAIAIRRKAVRQNRQDGSADHQASPAMPGNLAKFEQIRINLSSFGCGQHLNNFT